MMMANMTLYQYCVANVSAAASTSETFVDGNVTDVVAAAVPNVSAILECISTGYDEALAQVEATAAANLADLAGGLNSFWLIYAGALVYFMQPGFALLCAGSIRAKNVKNVTLWNLLDSCGGGLAYWAVGYAFSFGGDNPTGPKTFIGNANFFLIGNNVRFDFWFYEFAFACALSSIVAGTIAERTQMKAYLLYSAFLTGFVYPVCAHAEWSANGFLSPFSATPLWDTGALDFAGSGAVHMCGGVTALVAGIILGPRIGRFYDAEGNELEEPGEFAPNSVVLMFMGTFCLWFGWYGFNPGSTLLISTTNLGQVAAIATVNTTLAACAGAVSAMFTSTLIDWWYTGVHTYDVAYTINGCLTGLAAITSGCAVMDTWAGVVTGIVAGWVYIIWSKTLIKLKIDDAVDAVPVHFGGGMWGMIATGLFANPDYLKQAYGRNIHVGWFYEWGQGSGNGTLLAAQICAVLFMIGWCTVIMGTFFYGLKVLGWLRIDPLEEEVGMDISRHKGAAWTLEAADEKKVDDLRSSRRGKKYSIDEPEKEHPVETPAATEA